MNFVAGKSETAREPDHDECLILVDWPSQGLSWLRAGCKSIESPTSALPRGRLRTLRFEFSAIEL